MKTRPTFLVAVLATAVLSAPALAQSPCESAGNDAAVGAIKAQRAAFNRAIAVEDLDGIASILHPDVILVTGTDSDVFQGRAAQLAIWASDFGDPGRAVYVRTTHCVRVSPVFPLALETGEWRGERSMAAGGEPDFAAGRYVAKWRRVDGTWLLESEIFATESCGGGFCPGVGPR